MHVTVILAFAAAFVSGALAVLVLWNDHRTVALWSFVAGMLLFSAESVFQGLSVRSTAQEEIIYWQEWALLAMSFLPGIWIMFSLTYARGNHRDFLKKWRYGLMAVFALPVGSVAFYDGLFESIGLSEAGQHWVLRLGVPGIILYLAFLLSTVLVLMNLERTFRAAVGTIRWRIKFMVLGLGLIFAVRAYLSSQSLLFRSVDSSLQVISSAALLLGCVLALRSVLRLGHFESNVYPSQSLLHGSITVLLAGIYLFIVGVLAKVATWLGGDATFTAKAFIVLIGLVLLTMLLLSDRVRLQTRRFVSRHFQRPLYDYRTVWRKFVQGTASCVKQPDLCQAAAKLITDIFEVLSVSIWLFDEKKENLVLGASTFLSETRADELKPQIEEIATLIAELEKHPEPIDLDLSKERWAMWLRRCHPDEFHKGGNRLCAPLLAGGTLLGVIIIGDRVAGVAFSSQDADLLKCIADEMAAGLMNLQLSQKLLQAKELEAFQTMSAFFVHDLKNTASTLNLMLQNLPMHFQDPAFREDALRGVAKTVAHINHLIGRLSLLRHELQIKPVKGDLNALVARALAGWEDAPGVSLVKELRPVPEVLVDEDQMLKVVTNLVLNAREAVSRSGHVRVGTSQNNGWAVLTVTDNGCGMSLDFLRRSLFRPFQTTKKNGLGIGMFQSKMIVEAHGGRIEVDTEAGKGTAFRILLPVQKNTP